MRLFDDEFRHWRGCAELRIRGDSDLHGSLEYDPRRLIDRDITEYDFPRCLTDDELPALHLKSIES
jgi:hypothetical protein